MKHAISFTAALLALLIIAGCAAPSGAVKKAGPLRAGAAVSLDFVLVATSSSLGNVETEKSRLNDAIISGLNERQLFQSVSGNKASVGAGGGIKVCADIREIKKVSDRARTWTGALAGRARIGVQVTVSDLNSGNPIETFEVEGQSGKSAFAGTTDEAIQRAADQIVLEVVKINAQTTQ
jgi:hypothetical protein